MSIKEETANTYIIPRKNERELDVKIQLGTGKLYLDGSTEEIMEGLFTVMGESTEPDIEYDISETGKGTLVVPQRSINSWKNLRSAKQKWDIALNGELPLTLKLELGAGKSRLGLSRLNLVDVHIESGIGETEIDLTGDWKKSFKMKIDTGVGKMKIRLPSRSA
ncbi:toast rack family protein [Pseudalkalibacillus sp. A8]|uniref:toast rack family protein n=1 Tax=Pseudalkalibacillus sp. A8 TaxID=3382641 RepID=UPI0038B68A93